MFHNSSPRNFRLIKIYDIAYIAKCILPMHVFLECYTVLRVYSIRKGKELLKKILGSKKMQARFREFNKKDAEKTSVARNDEEVLSQFYASATELSLNSLRYSILHKKVATATTPVTPETLPPTSNAAMFHSYRTYHQTQVWRGESIDPLGWVFSIHRKDDASNYDRTTCTTKLLKIVR